jgi:hypothetical protein
MSLRIGLAVLVWVVCMSVAWSAPRAAVQEPDGLPAGKGREILETACTSCHEFEEILKLRGKLTADEWRTMVRTMIDYGAEVSAKDLDVLVEYLTQHLGKRD